MHALRTPWLMWSIAVAFYFYQFILRASPNVLSDVVMEEFAIDAKAFGAMAGAYYYTYASLQLPLGYAMDYFGVKHVLRVTTFLCSLGALGFALAPSYGWLFASRLFIGFGAAAGFMGAVRIGSLWFPPHYLGTIVGATGALGKIGGLSAGILLSWCLYIMPWRHAMGVTAALGLALTCILFLFLQEPLRKKVAPPTTAQTSFKDIIEVLKNITLWKIGMYGCLMFIPLPVLTDAWGIPFLQRVHPTLSKTGAATLVSLLFVGGALGGPLLAWFSDRLGRRLPVMVTSSVTTALASGAFVWDPGVSVLLTGLLLFLIGFLMTGQTLVFADACERVPPSYGGIALGVANTLIMFSGVIFQPVIGFLLSTETAMVEGGLVAYTLEDYRYALSSLPVAILCSLLFLIGVKERSPKPLV